MVLSGIFGNETAEKVLLFLENYGSGYPRGIAKAFELSISQVQNQLERFEREGIVASRFLGKTRMYEWNPRYLFLPELHAMLKKALKHLPDTMHEKYFRARMRPRRKGKPLSIAWR